MGRISFEGYQPKHLSFSTVNSYRSCGKRVYLEKVLQLEQRPGLAGVGGNGVHYATEEIDALIWEHGIDVLDQEDGAEPEPGF